MMSQRQLILIPITLLCFASILGRAKADQPTISRLEPAGFQSGTEVEMQIRGARLGDASEILLYDEGVEVIELKPDGDSKVNVKLRISENCTPGLQSLRLATTTGISNLRYFGVSPLVNTSEVEPNSDFSQPQEIDKNTTINGVVKTEDVDYFAVDLEAGETVTVEIEGLRLGTEFFDPFVAILDDQRFEVARSDDAPLLQQDCVCSYMAEKAGKYIIEVRESAFGGNDRCQYRLHVGDFPRPLSIVPAGGRPGETISAYVVDASGITWEEKITLPNEVGEFDFVAKRDGKSAPSANKLRVVDMANVSESIFEDDRSKLELAEGPVAFNGVLEKPGDVDWFKIKGKKNQTLNFTVFGRKVLRSPIDSWLEIHKLKGGRLALNDDSGGPDSKQAFKFPEDGEYLVSIRDQLHEGSPLHAYRIEVSAASPSVSLTIDELQRYVSQTMEVPQGGQMAVLLRARRSGFGGDLDLNLLDLPAGIRVVTPKINANQSYIPFMLQASPDASPDAALATLQASGPKGVKGSLNQRTMLVRGQNNRDMWGHNSDKLSVAVTDELPFSIELVQPEVPIVRGGSSHYLVKAHRKEGYKERIYLRALYNPSGLRASGSIRIEPDKNEALIPVTANTKAALGSFPITVLARAKSRNASVWLASEFVDLTVEDSFFNFSFPKTVVEQQASGVINLGVEIKRPPEGEVEFEVVGLPAGVKCEQSKIKLVEGQKQLAFPITVAKEARVGQFKTIYVKAVITRPGGKITQTAGRGEVQIVAPPANAPVVAQKAAPKTEAPSKPLSRLEQLRKAKGLLKGGE